MSDHHSRTRKGTKANHPVEKLVNVTNGDIVLRLRKSKAQALVEKGWSFCPKKWKPVL